jgi:hypothetical protein
MQLVECRAHAGDRSLQQRQRLVHLLLLQVNKPDIARADEGIGVLCTLALNCVDDGTRQQRTRQ